MKNFLLKSFLRLVFSLGEIALAFGALLVLAYFVEVELRYVEVLTTGITIFTIGIGMTWLVAKKIVNYVKVGNALQGVALLLIGFPVCLVIMLFRPSARTITNIVVTLMTIPLGVTFIKFSGIKSVKEWINIAKTMNE